MHVKVKLLYRRNESGTDMLNENILLKYGRTWNDCIIMYGTILALVGLTFYI